MEDFRNKFKINELQIKDFKYWVISLHTNQITIGTLLMSLKRECFSLAELTHEEATEMKEVFFFASKLLGNSFKPDKMNYLSLMMIDKQIHFHVIPRYEDERVFENQVVIDEKWPAPPDILNYNKNLSLNNLLIELKKWI